MNVTANQVRAITGAVEAAWPLYPEHPLAKVIGPLGKIDAATKTMQDAAKTLREVVDELCPTDRGTLREPWGPGADATRTKIAAMEGARSALGNAVRSAEDGVRSLEQMLLGTNRIGPRYVEYMGALARLGTAATDARIGAIRSLPTSHECVRIMAAQTETAVSRAVDAVRTYQSAVRATVPGLGDLASAGEAMR